MSNNFQYRVPSNPLTNFLTALAGASSTLTPPYAATPINQVYGLPAIASRFFLLRAVSIVATENFGPELDFYATQTGLFEDGSSSFIARMYFTGSNGWQSGGAGSYEYYVDQMAIPLWDADSFNSNNQPSLHIAMQNVDTTAKSAGVPGAVTVTCWVEPMQAF